MSKDYRIKVRPTQIHTRDITQEKADQYLPFDNMIRVYKSSPNGACLQLRTFGPTRPRGIPRRILSAVDYLDIEQLDELIANLQAVRKEIAE